MPEKVRVVKDNLFEPPVIFKLIQDASRSDDKEMYQVFNMGTRLEIYTNEKDAESIISVSKKFWRRCARHWQGRGQYEKRIINKSINRFNSILEVQE